MRAVVLAFALAALPAQLQAREADPLRVEKIVSAFIALCPLASDQAVQQAARDRAAAQGLIEVGMVFSHGPGGLAHEGHAGIDGETLDIGTFDAADGYCFIRFSPGPRAALEAEISKQLGVQAEALPGWSSWVFTRSDVEARVIYRPFAPGQTGPVWISGGASGYAYGFDAADRKDAIIFYPTPR